MINLFNKKVLILGGGRTGISIAKFCEKKGAKIFIYDEKNDNFLNLLKNKNIVGGKINFNKLNPTEYNYIIQSPGIPRNHIFLKKADKNNIIVLGDIELISNFCKIPIIAVTGTNGKTTITYILKHLFEKCNRKVAVAGNIGIPFADVLNDSLEYIILEVSSYQLETIKYFKPHISIISNLSPDHLERHKTMKKYFDIKKKIFINMNKKDYLIFNFDDSYFYELRNKKYSFKKLGVSIKKIVNGIYLQKNKVYLRLNKKESIFLFNKSIVKIKGEHNLINIMFAYLVAFILGCDYDSLNKGIKSFKGINHRIEYVTKINGVFYYNDSKATNPEATITAIKSFKEKKIYLILGGSFKDVKYDLLVDEIKSNKIIPVIQGETKEIIKKNFTSLGFLNFFEAKNLRKALFLSFKEAKKGDVILLSPACPSFDQFKNFEERGEKFKKYIYELKKYYEKSKNKKNQAFI